MSTVRETIKNVIHKNDNVVDLPLQATYESNERQKQLVELAKRNYIIEDLVDKTITDMKMNVAGSFYIEKAEEHFRLAFALLEKSLGTRRIPYERYLKEGAKFTVYSLELEAKHGSS